LTKVVCMSTSHIAYINTLGEAESIVAISGGRYISDSIISSGVADGTIADIGFESSISYEKLMQLKPDIVFTYGISGENNLYIQKIRDIGIKVIALGDYMEEHPLGKLEYLKLFGELYCKGEYADSLYNSVKDRYNKVAQRVADIEYRPVILLNAPWKEIWYIPGENNYMSHLIRDAGGEVLLSKEGDSHSYTNSIEEVFASSHKASLWLNPNFYSTISELRSSNPLFSKMNLLSSGKVFNNTKRNTERGGSDFWERGVVEPDIILNDLINIIHPDKGDSGELKYYIKLK
ncbi:MAG: ABC transporter substrate-binding protein, partial [Bacteroidales bacterium]|nr:ABC transporter substrate-binding protein [Bacteroidales bacterium]